MRHGWLLVWVTALLGGCDQDAVQGAASSSATAPASASASATASVSASASASSAAEPPAADPDRLKLTPLGHDADAKLTQGALLVAEVDPKTRDVKFPGHRVVIGRDGRFLVGFYRNAPPRETLTITFPDGARLEKVFEIEQREYGEDRIDGLPERFVRLSPERKAALAQANIRIAKARKTYSKKPFYDEGFAWPLAGKITSRYGVKRILNGTDGGLHWGIDIAAPVGAKVKAPGSGIVAFVEEDVPLAGHTLVIDHGHGLSSTLIHLKDFLVKVGDEVKKGDVVATVGMTGRTNGPHLDWRMNLFETYRLDPELLVPPME